MTDNAAKQSKKKLPAWVAKAQAELEAIPKEEFERRSMEAQAKLEALELRKKIAPSGEFPPEQGQLFTEAPYPTDFCRVSPFYPANRNQVNQIKYLKREVITDSSWGRLIYSGEQLTTYDEDVLIGIFTLLSDANIRKRELTDDGNPTYTYQGSLLALLKSMPGETYRPNKKSYNRVLDSLERLVGAVITIEIYKRNSRGKRKVMGAKITNMLTYADWVEREDGSKEFKITINPYFAELYGQGLVSLIDKKIRNAISSPVAKCLHRFISSQREDKWPGHYMVLAIAINLDVQTQPKYQIRRQIKNAIAELVKVGYLDQGSGFLQDRETVVLRRIPRKRKKTKLLPG
ncbi:MAG TPA: hypothetical protein PLX62_10435 [Bacteroidales bacterium]|jgi:hypothetical protein|nr:hypothetical protein [Bacteroidales bacterium]HQB53310.1 hypothetical protein [Bacteroidales bacterium]